MRHGWKDISSWSQSDRIGLPPKAALPPRTTELEIDHGRLRVTVTRHIDFPPSVWVLSCHPDIFGLRALECGDLDDAQAQAELLVEARLRRWAIELKKATAKRGKSKGGG